MQINTALASANPQATSWTNHLFTASRILLGAILLFSVANAVFQFAPQPQPPQAAMAFLGGLFSAPYFFALLKGTEFLIALALLTNRFVPLAAVVLAPITINIVLFHLFLAPAGMGMVAALVLFHAVTIWSRRENYNALFAAK